MNTTAAQCIDNVDVLIIGGGINGTGIARDAAGRGLKVLLCEKQDLAGATSSASSKLIHGGLRYLEQYEFRLVREALAEREVLLHNAPHIVHPMRFVLPHNKNLRPAWMIRLGLFLYDHLAKRSKNLPGSQQIPLANTSAYALPLKDSIKKGFIYSDCNVDDSRLVILNAIDAQTRGAQILPRCECIGLKTQNNTWLATLRHQDGTTRIVQAKILVNAAGPWVDNIQNLAAQHGSNATGKRKLRLVKGSHLVTPRLYEGTHAYILQNKDKRIVFVTPYRNDFSMIGTTDIDFHGDPANVAISAEETDYLLQSVNAYFKQAIRHEDIVSTWSGVRPLYDDAHGNASTTTRDYVFDVSGGTGSSPPLLSVFGGKITTYRKLAEHALEKLAPFTGKPQPWTHAAPLPGADLPNADINLFISQLQKNFPWLPKSTASRYACAYGTLALLFLAEKNSIESLGQHFGHDLYETEVKWLQAHEWANCAEDILWRRTRLGLYFTPEQTLALQKWLKKHTIR
ncbi:glycerol-3-phosphate dehydrogenase [Advenella sp. WQ 585]|uniref:Glycerol-3-phosphate dehydrogenase n=1 Tax=Advenella mandrilli TaxID=2800330 RepID=A0ABS1EDH1_9BURK|nr:glycerol-3-phosphate dehydrogenase [Advenella mandrilli]MBK1781686.1 glycerol-3-phosphate dehydrogenase [Advenella mandrilli]